MGCASGNMVITEPKNSDTIRYAHDGLDHSDGFVSLSNLFVESNIDVEPERTHYNALYLRGNEIVVDGEINMYVYDPGTNNANGLFAAVTGIVQKIARNYRFSTVVIGTPSSLATTVADPMPRASGGLGSCGKIYFGDDDCCDCCSCTEADDVSSDVEELEALDGADEADVEAASSEDKSEEDF